VVLNVLIMAATYEGMSPTLLRAYTYCNWAFTGLNCMEAVIKLAALGCLEYLQSNWNRFDLVVLSASILGIASEVALGDVISLSPGMLRVLRMARVARLLKMSRNLLGVRALLLSVHQALQEVGNVLLLVMLFFFVYAALGVELFGTLGCTSAMCVGFDNYFSGFTNFGQGFFTLLRLVTGDDASAMLIDATRKSPYCDDSAACTAECCTQPVLAELFFVTFYVGARFVLLNFVIGILIEQLRLAHQTQLVEEVQAQQLELDTMDEEELLARLGLEADLGVRDENAVGTSSIMQAKVAADEKRVREAESRWHVAASDKYVKAKDAPGTADEVPLSMPPGHGSKPGTASPGVALPRLGSAVHASQTRPLTGFSPSSTRR